MAFPLRAFTTATLLGVSTTTWATPGALDTTFGTSGQVITDLSSLSAQANAVAIQPDGKIVTAGAVDNAATGNSDFAVVRYNTDGTLDTRFGTGGIVTADGGMNEFGEAIALQPDGKVLVAGTTVSSISSFALVRYNPDGSLDRPFCHGTMLRYMLSYSMSGGFVRAIALQPDGKIVLAGSTTLGAGSSFVMVRYTSDGVADTRFGSNGYVSTPIGSGASADAIALQPDGKIVLAGSTVTNEVVLARYNIDGSLDTRFGSGGIVTTPGAAGVSAIALQPDGKLLAAGSGSSVFTIGLMRYNTDGSLDASFGSGGIVTTVLGTLIGNIDDHAYAIALQPDGKVLVAGHSNNALNHYEFALLRYNANGSLDTSFGSGGIVTTPIASYSGARAIALQPDGKAVAAGYAMDVSSKKFGLVRFVASDTAWDLTPDPISFADQGDAPFGSPPTSNTVTISGLGAGVEVPVRVSGGSYSLNGGAYDSGTGWVKNGDMLTVRQPASSSPTTTMTVLTLGGPVTVNSANVLLGATVRATFTSTTAATASANGGSGGSGGSASGSSGGSSGGASGSNGSAGGSSGGGAFGLAALLLLGLFDALRRRTAA